MFYPTGGCVPQSGEVRTGGVRDLRQARTVYVNGVDLAVDVV